MGTRLCENSAWYNRTQNFEACGRAQSKKMQKFVLRSALRPNQISFSHSLDPKPATVEPHLDHLVGADDQRSRNFEAERLAGFEVED